jgi:hypothetical protein
MKVKKDDVICDICYHRGRFKLADYTVNYSFSEYLLDCYPNKRSFQEDLCRECYPDFIKTALQPNLSVLFKFSIKRL